MKQKVVRQDAEHFLHKWADDDRAHVSLIVFDPPDGIDVDLFRLHLSIAFDACSAGGSLVFIGSNKLAAVFSDALVAKGADRMGDITLLWNYPGKERKKIRASSQSSQITWFIKTGFRGRHYETVELPSNVLVSTPVPFERRKNFSQRPVEVMNYIISALSDNRGTVLDPYCGAGTTLVSAAINGRAAAGCDTSAEQVAFAKERLMLIEDESAAAGALYWWLGKGRYKQIEGGEL